ncbi:MAG: hypothetical protein AB8F74_11450 [Saprospiraceae bacterium]
MEGKTFLYIRQIWMSLTLIIFAYSCSNKGIELSSNHKFVINEGYGTVDLKNNIPDGKYYIIEKDECKKKDTLLVGTVRNGRRDGQWIYREKQISGFPCGWVIGLSTIDSYNNGNLIKSEYHSGSVVIETHYAENQKLHNGDRKITYYHYSDGKRKIDSVLIDKSILRFEYDKDNVLTTKTKFIRDTHFVMQYYPNGIKSAEYKIVIGKNGKKDSFDGLLKRWNEKGELISTEKYDMGELEQIEQIE